MSSFGGEKGEKNISEEQRFKELEDKVKELAKHCVDFIIEENTQCPLDDKTGSDERVDDDFEASSQGKQLFQPRSVRGL